MYEYVYEYENAPDALPTSHVPDSRPVAGTDSQPTINAPHNGGITGQEILPLKPSPLYWEVDGCGIFQHIMGMVQ